MEQPQPIKGERETLRQTPGDREGDTGVIARISPYPFVCFRVQGINKLHEGWKLSFLLQSPARTHPHFKATVRPNQEFGLIPKLNNLR